MFNQEIQAMTQKGDAIEQVFYSPQQLARALGVGSTKLYEMFKADGFPKPTTNPYFRNKYNFSEVVSWIYSQ